MLFHTNHIDRYCCQSESEDVWSNHLFVYTFGLDNIHIRMLQEKYMNDNYYNKENYTNKYNYVFLRCASSNDCSNGFF